MQATPSPAPATVSDNTATAPPSTLQHSFIPLSAAADAAQNLEAPAQSPSPAHRHDMVQLVQLETADEGEAAGMSKPSLHPVEY